MRRMDLTYIIEMGSVSMCLEKVIQEMKQSVPVTIYSTRVPVNTMVRLPSKDWKFLSYRFNAKLLKDRGALS